ncbi:MAG: DnaJ domain-containing protein, partial [Gammaproteobacteria bacterium]|nr:DnaJ domain-containing protein [Gammaproteobacteria bacterium]
MKIEDAAKILELTGTLTTNDIKKAYKKASFKFHPDRGGSNKMMQVIVQAYETLKNFEGEIDAGELGYSDLLNEALNKIIDLPGIEIEICGAWIWLTGSTSQHSKILGKKEGGAGFSYASKKKAWYYRPADWKSASRGSFSLDKIRD